MKITISREQLLPPLQNVIGAVERKQTMPILGNVLFKMTGEKLQLTATDLEIEHVCFTNASASEDGEFTISARKLFDICKNLPDDALINLNVDDTKAVLTSGRSRFSLSALPSKDFPALDDIDFNIEFSVPQKTLALQLSKTSFAMAQQDVRYYLNGLLLSVEDSKLLAVTTDGHRLSLSEKELENSGLDNMQVIVPRKGVLELQRILAKEGESNVTIRLSGNHIQFATDDLVMTSKLIDGRFPEYRRVVPAEVKHIAVIDRDQLKQCLLRTSILSNEKYRGVRLKFEPGQLQIEAQNPDHEEAEEQLEINYSGDEVDIGFNVTYLLDVLNNIAEDSVEFGLIDSNSSCLIQDKGDVHSKYVIMPMRL